MNDMRVITAHALEGELGDMNMKVAACGPCGPGGAQANYAIGEGVPIPQGVRNWFGGEPPMGVAGVRRWLANIRFQVGDPAEGVNGVTLEALLAVCHDRLACFQAGPHACDHNAEALAHIDKALEALKDRTRERDTAQR